MCLITWLYSAIYACIDIREGLKLKLREVFNQNLYETLKCKTAKN